MQPDENGKSRPTDLAWAETDAQRQITGRSRSMWNRSVRAKLQANQLFRLFTFCKKPGCVGSDQHFKIDLIKLLSVELRFLVEKIVMCEIFYFQMRVQCTLWDFFILCIKLLLVFWRIHLQFKRWISFFVMFPFCFIFTLTKCWPSDLFYSEMLLTSTKCMI